MEHGINKANLVKSIMENEELLLSIGDVANALKVSTRQLRYWEQKGYIESQVSKSGQRKYTYSTMFKAANIANFLSQGFTLAKSVEKTQRHAQVAKEIREFLKERLDFGEETESGFQLDLGEVKDFPLDKHLFLCLMNDGEKFFQIKSINKD